MLWWGIWFLMFCMTIGSCSRCKIVVIKCHLLQFGMLRGKMANSPIGYAAYLVTSHFYNKCHQNLLTVITLCLPKMTKLSLTDKLRTHMLTCMAHR